MLGVLFCFLPFTVLPETGRAQGQEDLPSALIFPHLADGGGYRTHFLLTNATGTDTVARLSLFSDNGSPLRVLINNQESSSFDVPIPARGSIKLETSGESAQAVTGWAKLTSTPHVDLNGTAIFQSYVGGILAAEASAPAVVPVAAVDFVADETGGFATGFAIVNPAGTPAQGTLSLRRADGTLFGTADITVDPEHHVATYLWQMLEGAPSGRVDIAFSSGYVAVTALRLHTSSVFSALPVGQPGFVPSGISAHFSPGGGIRERVISAINRAQSTLDIAIYSFTADAISTALVNARNRGVVVRIIADESQSIGFGSEIAKLEGLGFELRRKNGVSGGIMHHKYMIIDGRILLTGSYNWSASAEDSNFENAVFLQGTAVIRRFQEDFESIWRR
jgi:hypothetical protein